MGLRMTELSKLIHDFSFGEHGKVFLVRNDGLIQVHPDAAFSGKRQLAEQLGADAAKAVMTGGEAAQQPLQPRRRNYLALGLPLRDLNWTLVAEVPESEIYAQMHQAVWLTSLIGGGVALVSLLLVVLLARGLVRPIRRRSPRRWCRLAAAPETSAIAWTIRARMSWATWPGLQPLPRQPAQPDRRSAEYHRAAAPGR
jgi:methyl-accepting chemotaxis protein